MDQATGQRDSGGAVKVIHEGALDGRRNMEKDAELLKHAEEAGVYLRVYRWDGPWVSLGRFQKPERALKRPDQIRWAMRPTGGKAVLHGHDLTVTIAANLADLGLRGEEARRVATVYRKVVLPLCGALTRAGLSAEIAEDTTHVKSGGHTADCFAHVSPNDVVDPATGEKVCGCALRLTNTAVLLQSSVPLTSPLIDPVHVFDAPAPVASERNLNESLFVGELSAAFERFIQREALAR